MNTIKWRDRERNDWVLVRKYRMDQGTRRQKY